MKRTWETPKLIVLVRNNPQEAVLSACKGGEDAMITGWSPDYAHTGCTSIVGTANAPVCEGCNQVTLT